MNNELTIPHLCDLCECDIGNADIEEENYVLFQLLPNGGGPYIAHKNCWHREYG